MNDRSFQLKIMSSSHCLGKSRQLRQERVAIRRATVPVLANGDRGRDDLSILYW